MRIKWISGDRKLAYSLALVEISHWAQFKDGVTNLEANWLYLLSDLLTRKLTLTESGISLAVQVFHFVLPLILKSIVLFRRNGKEGTTCVDNSRVSLSLLTVLERLSVVEDVFGVHGPRSDI